MWLDDEYTMVDVLIEMAPSYCNVNIYNHFMKCCFLIPVITETLLFAKSIHSLFPTNSSIETMNKPCVVPISCRETELSLFVIFIFIIKPLAVTRKFEVSYEEMRS